MGDSDELGGYRLERLLGRGTMGSVYLARPSTGDDLPVAIKRVSSIGTPEDRSRLRREAETMASLSHPNIVRVLDVVDDGEGIALVMSFADGGTLAARIVSGQGMAPEEVQTTIAPIAEALAAAHRQGVLHRDVKPSNILFAHDGRPLLADFGIARNAAHTNLTNTNMAMGTAGYLDPDLADGVEPSPASDQYALGVVAYEALTGTPPFVAASSPLAVLRAADRGDHQALDPAIHGPIAHVIERAFARDSSRRFPNLDAFADALRQPESVIHQPEADQAFSSPSGSAGAPTSPSGSAGASATPHTSHTPGFATRSSADEVAQPIDATRAIRRRTTITSLAEATPVLPNNTRRRNGLIAVFICALGIVATAVTVNARKGDSLKSLGLYPFPICNAQTTSQCVKSAVRTAKGMQVGFENDSRGVYTIGESTDALIVGNWFCGSRATLALYRPRTGVIYYFNNWPDPDGETTTALVDATQIKGAQLSAGDQNKDDCADIALDLDGMRTWFLPHDQPSRLSKAPPTDPVSDVSATGSTTVSTTVSAAAAQVPSDNRTTTRAASPAFAVGGSATLDSATPDSATPNSVALDSASPDSATPDSATPDSATPNSVAPDSATPDSVAPNSVSTVTAETIVVGDAVSETVAKLAVTGNAFAHIAVSRRNRAMA